jgi:hypothetical protein
MTAPCRSTASVLASDTGDNKNAVSGGFHPWEKKTTVKKGVA